MQCNQTFAFALLGMILLLTYSNVRLGLSVGTSKGQLLSLSQPSSLQDTSLVNYRHSNDRYACHSNMFRQVWEQNYEHFKRNEPILTSLVRFANETHVLIAVGKNVKDYLSWANADWYCNQQKVEIVEKDGRTWSPATIRLICPFDKDPLHTVMVDTGLPTTTTTATRIIYNTTLQWNCESNFPINLPSNIKFAACAKYRTEPGVSLRMLREWMAYHTLLGVQHFILYINEPMNDDNSTLLLLPQSTHITYIPYDFQTGQPRIRNYFMRTQINDCISRARQWGIEWLALMDVDEYFQVLDTVSLKTEAPLLTFLQQRNSNLQFYNVFFGKHPTKETLPSIIKNQTNTNDHLLIDYVWRKKSHSGDRFRNKVIVKPKETHYVLLHWITNPTNSVYLPNIYTEARMNHYKCAEDGPKLERYETNLDIVKDTSLRDQYRDKVVTKMKDFGWW